MAGNKFVWPEFKGFSVVSNNSEVVGHIRIKPSGILWCPSGKHSWHRVMLDQFAEFAVKEGKIQKT